MIKKVVGMYYSPAGGTANMTQRLVRDIASRIDECSPEDISSECYDIMKPDALPCLDNETVVVIGMPVYVGKIPLPAVRSIRSISGNGVLTFGIVSYSGRNYGNALYELKHFADDRDFCVIGAGAFAISYRAARGSSRSGSLKMDLDAMSEFSSAACSKLMRLGGCDVENMKIKPAPLDVKGRMPIHKISKISPSAAAIAQGVLERLSLKRQNSEWFL